MTTPAQPYMFDGFHITGHRQHTTHDGVAFVCAIREKGKKVGNAEQSGQGGSTLMFFDDRTIEDRFIAAARAFNKQNDEASPYETADDEPIGDLDDLFLLYLIEATELDRKSKKQTIFKTSTVDYMGLREHLAFKPPLRPEQLAQIPKRYPTCTHAWIIGVGWTPLT